MHANASTAELPEVFARIFPAVFAGLTEQGVTDMGHVTAIYHSMDANQMELSAGIEIGDGVEPAEPLELLELPACDAVKADHFGPYDQLAQDPRVNLALRREARSDTEQRSDRALHHRPGG